MRTRAGPLGRTASSSTCSACRTAWRSVRTPARRPRSRATRSTSRTAGRSLSERCVSFARQMYPIVVVLFDVLAGRAHAVLKGRTGNEAARTPNLDRLAAVGSCGLLYAVGPGRAPSSEVAHWSMLGYRPDEFP